jgi:hypothetical protein
MIGHEDIGMHLARKNGRELLEKTEIEAMIRFAAKARVSINSSLDDVKRIVGASDTQLTSHAPETRLVARRMTETTPHRLAGGLLKN